MTRTFAVVPVVDKVSAEMAEDIALTWEQLVRRLVEASDKEIAPEQIRRATSLRDDLDLGSLQAITLVMDLEDDFDIEVEVLEGLETVGDIQDLIEAKLRAAEAKTPT